MARRSSGMPQAVGIVGLAPVQGLACGALDAVRRVEIRLADLQVHHVHALRLHALGGLHDFHDLKGGHLVYAFGNIHADSPTPRMRDMQ